jgi:hypothetical protein
MRVYPFKTGECILKMGVFPMGKIPFGRIGGNPVLITNASLFPQRYIITVIIVGEI